MSEPAHFTHLELKNFTVFRDAKFDFVDQINVFVGENGSGKTHLLKLLYSVHLAEARNSTILEFLSDTFQVSQAKELIQHHAKSKTANAKVRYGNVSHRIEITEKFGVTSSGGSVTNALRPIFIPALDMIGHTRRFLTTYDEYQIDFDLTHRDIVSLLLAPEKRNPSNHYAELLQMLQAKTGGEVEEEQERFYLKTPYGRQPMPLVAEGLRKLATLSQLIKNGWFQPGTSLFWDEPETNLNPALMDEIVTAILELSRNGVQVFLATHSYLLLKELEIQRKREDSIRYFALERQETETKVHPANSYLELSPNLIEDQYISVHDRMIEKRLAESGRKSQ